MRKLYLIFYPLLLILPSLLSAQRTVYNKNGLSLQIRASITGSYQHTNVQGKVEDRYIWEVEAIFRNTNSSDIYLHSFYLKRTTKCWEGEGDAFKSNCKIGTVLENRPVTIRASSNQAFKGCFDSNCSEDLDIDWFISNWSIKIEGELISAPFQTNITTFKSGSGSGMDQSLLAEMEEVKRLYPKMVIEKKRNFENSKNALPFTFEGGRAITYESYYQTIINAEISRRTALVMNKRGKASCVKFYLQHMHASYVAYKEVYPRYFEALQPQIAVRSPSTFENSINIEKYYDPLYDKYLRKIFSDAAKFKGNEDCSFRDDVEENWNESDYPPISLGNFNPEQSTQAPTASRPSSNFQNSGSSQFQQPSNEASSTTFQANIDAGREAREKKDYETAVTYFTQAIGASPNSPVGYVERGRSLLFSNQANKALSDFNRAVYLGSKDYLLFFLRAQAKVDLNRAEESIEDFTKSLSLLSANQYGTPMKALIILYRGLAYEKLKQYQNALDDFKESSRMTPNDNTYALEAINRVTPLVQQNSNEPDDEDAFHITNSSDQTHSFQLSSNGQNWDSFTLNGGASSKYWFPDKNQGFVRIETSGKIVKYVIKNGMRIQIEWNSSKGVWDFAIAQ